MTDEMIADVMIIVMEETDLKNLSSESRFDEIGVDSLDFLCIVNRVRNEIGPIDNLMLGSIEKIIDLASAVEVSVN